jgi:hypothetical protein
MCPYASPASPWKDLLDAEVLVCVAVEVGVQGRHERQRHDGTSVRTALTSRCSRP